MPELTHIANIDVHIEGEGQQTMVMIHGWPDTYRIWEQQVAYFKQHYRCVRFTLPGFDIAKPVRGYSLQEVIASIQQVVDSVSPEKPVILMIHDWGCIFGYAYAQQYAHRVSHVIAVDIGDAGSPAFVKTLPLSAKAMIAAYQLPLATAWKIGGKLGNAITRTMAKGFKAPADAALIHAGMNYPYFIQWTKAFGSYKALTPFYPTQPFFFAYGRKKPFMFHSPTWVQHLTQSPQHRVMAFDSSHWVMVAQSDAFNLEVKNWLALTP